MVRTLAAFMLAFIVTVPTVRAEERPADDPVAPTPAVAGAWKVEAPKPSLTLRMLIASYVAAQGLDVMTTFRARARGAVEANPVLQGGDVQGAATKAALGAATMFAVRALDNTHHRKAAIVTMALANAATFAVVAHNVRVAKQLGR